MKNILGKFKTSHKLLKKNKKVYNSIEREVQLRQQETTLHKKREHHHIIS